MRIPQLRLVLFVGLCSLGNFAAGADFSVLTSSDSGPGSLRAAIVAANTTPGADRVVFNIPGSGVQTISVLSALPQITESLEIDGYTQPGAKPNSKAVGSDAVILIQVDGTQSTPDGLTINAPNCTIRGLALTNFIQRNPIFVTGGSGIALRGGSGNKVEGCFLGLNADGTTARPNGIGLSISTTGTVVGGISPAQRNVVSGNALIGILMTADGTLIAGNYVGTDATGTRAAPNPNGIQVGGSFTTSLIGGTVPGAGNLVSGNFVGVGLGVSTNALIAGISDGMVVQGNLVGTAANGVDPLGNLQGILINGSRNLIGGSNASAGNVVAFNASNGIAIRDGTGNSVLSNSIYANNPINLALNASGRIVPNDIGDGDFGPNNLQNFPAIESVAIANNSASIKGNLNSTPNTQFTIQLFAESQSLTDSKQTYLGITTTTTNANGDASFTAVVPVPGPDVRINATATNSAGDTSEFFLNVGHYLNISSRARVETGEKVLIAGFVLNNDGHIAVRALGPSLISQFVPNPLLDPVLELYRGNQLVGTNDNWGDDSNSASALRNDGLALNYPAESALDMNVFAGVYTVVVRGKNNGTGAAVVEVYDLSDSHSGGTSNNFPNISTRAFVQTGDDALIGGITIGRGELPPRVVARAIGPSLANAGVANPLQNPTLELRDSDGILVAANDDWKESQETAIQSTGLAPQNNAESAILTRLGPGAYTAIVRGKAGSSGIGLVELYRVP
ncbi:MAG: trimeric autotransporter adhesin [Verrucomicrobiota bacterium]